MLDINEYNTQKTKLLENSNQLLTKLETSINYLNEVSINNILDEEKNNISNRVINPLKEDKVKISVLAEVSNGKSTLLNSLLFKKKILDARIGETTAKLYYISYSDNYRLDNKSANNEEELKLLIKESNEKFLKKVESKESFNISDFEVNIYIPSEFLKNGIVVIDTPGFGTLNEDIMLNLAKKAIDQSDGIIFILDISQGLKKSDRELFAKLSKMIKPDKRYIIFNKIDAVEEEVEDFEKIGKKTINEINKVLKEQGYDELIDENNKVFYLSAMKYLNSIEKDKSSQYIDIFNRFEGKFWNDIIEYKEKHFLKDKEDNLNRIKQISIKKVSDLNNSFQNEKENLEKDKNIILEKQVEVNSIIRELKKIIENAKSTLSSFRVNESQMIQQIKTNLIEQTGINRIIDEKITLMNAVFNKSQIESEIKNALENKAPKIVEYTINDYYTNIFSQVQDIIQNYNQTILKSNEKLENIGIKNYKFEEISYEKKDDNSRGIDNIGNISTDLDVFNTLLKGLFTGIATPALIRQLALSFGLGSLLGSSTLSILTGPVGWLIGAIVAIFYSSSTLKSKREEIKRKIDNSIESALNSIRDELIKINDVINDAFSFIRTKVIESEYSLKQIASSLETGNMDQQIEELENKILVLQKIINLLKN